MVSEEYLGNQDASSEDMDEAPPPLDPSWWQAILAEDENRSMTSSAKDREDDTGDENPFNEQDYHFRPGPVEWEIVSQLYEQDQLIELEVTGYNRGGLLVDGHCMQGFVPVSHLLGVRCEANDVENRLKTYIGRKLMLKVIECDQENGRVVFSERAALTEPGARIQLLNNLQPGDCVRGKVTNITNFGVFVDLGGVEGLVHVSELSWGRVQHPSDVVSAGQEVEAYVIQVNQERSRIALSFKQMQPNPWLTVNERYFPGLKTEAVVTSIVAFGAFARLEEGLDGLIHISEMGLEEGEAIPENILEEGQRVQVRIMHVDVAKQRLGLSLQLED
jgi:small subunit ribosomal protein S1